MKKKKILIFGGSGLVGKSLYMQFKDKYEILAPTRQDCDLLRNTSINKFLSGKEFDVIIYAAGITNQDICEKQKKLAIRINALATATIASIAEARQIPLVYFSTDAVFSGSREEIRKEQSKVNPVNYYGYTKAEGEKAVLAYHKNTVIRLISVYSNNFEIKLDFARRIVKDLDEKGITFGIIDQYFNPTYVTNICNGLARVVNDGISGVLHIASSDCISNYEFTMLVAKRYGYASDSVKPIRFLDFTTSKISKRGQYCCLDVEYSRKILGNGVFSSNKENIDSFYNNIAR